MRAEPDWVTSVRSVLPGLMVHWPRGQERLQPAWPISDWLGREGYEIFHMQEWATRGSDWQLEVAYSEDVPRSSDGVVCWLTQKSTEECSLKWLASAGA
jgi:hypothetical protein